VKGNWQIDFRKQFEQQLVQRFDVFGTIIENLPLLFGGERPTLHDALAHRVLALRRDAAQPEILQSSDQPLILPRNTFAIHLTFKFRAQVQNVLR